MSEQNVRNPQNFKELLKHCNAVQAHLENNKDDLEEAEREMSNNPEERRRILQEVMKGMSTNHPMELLQHNINLLKLSYKDSKEDELVEIIENLSDFVEDIDLAQAFINSKSCSIITYLLKNGDEKVKIVCLQFIASLVQNDENAKTTAFEENWFQTIMEIINDSSCPNTVLSAALSPISGLIRTKDGYQHFIKSNGVQSLTSWLNSGIDRCKTKSAFIIYNLIEEDSNRQSDFANKNLIETIITQLKPPHNQTTEMLARSLYYICNKSSISMQVLKSHWSDVKSHLVTLTSEAKNDNAIEEDIQWYLKIQQFIF